MRVRERGGREGGRDKERKGEIYIKCEVVSLYYCMYKHYMYIFCLFAVKADQQSKASTSQAPSAASGGEPMDITTPGDVTKVLVS